MSRLDRVRRGGDDRGFTLIFVLMVSTVIMIALATVATPNIPRARQAQNAVAAMAAARSGVDDVIAYLVSVPSCRSESRICPIALGQSSDALAQAGKPRPSLSTGQTFSWKTGAAATADGYLRVFSTGTMNGVSRRLVADLSLRPSILAYGYYTDYETQPSAFFNGYYTPNRNVYISDTSAWSNVSSTYRNGASAPQTASWSGPTNTARCDRHWYKEGTVDGRATNGTTWTEAGSLTSTSRATSRTGSCDLVFTSAMTENGLTFTRDAMNISTAGGTGPKFNQPVYTMWGYNDGDKRVYNSPAPTAGKIYRGDTMSGSPYYPAVAAADLQLPTSVSTDGIPENNCVYTGPTRVVLNGDGTATVTSPYTTTRNADSDPNCYPTGTLTASSMTGFKLNYQTIGGGTIQVKNLGTAPTTWPANPTKATNSLSANSEVFYYPPAATSPDAPTSAASDTCSSATFSAAVSATCAWTNIKTASDVGTAKGWATYTGQTCTAAAAAPTNRQVFECEYGQLAGTATPTVVATDKGQYATVRTLVKNYLAAGNCTTGTATAQATCLQSYLNATVLPQANTGKHAYNYATPANGDRQYVAVVSVGTATTGAAKAVGAVPTNPTPNDALFTWTGGVAAQETPTTTPITVTVYRQVRASGAWSTTAGTNYSPQFSFTDTNTTWNITTPASGTSYFPNLQDVTAYNAGTTSAGVVAGSTGVNQPGDLYVEGKNSGKLSLVAQNDVIVTGNISNPANYSPSNHAVSIVAGDDVRNYHPVSCKDQTAADINATTAGFCPNDINGLNSSNLVDGTNSLNASHPAMQYVNMITPNTDRSIDAAVFALKGSLRTDNYDRGVLVGNLTINGGLYQSHRGANGVQYTSDNGSYVARSGTTLIYNYVDLQRADLPYVPPSTSGNYTRPWNVVSLSAG